MLGLPERDVREAGGDVSPALEEQAVGTDGHSPGLLRREQRPLEGHPGRPHGGQRLVRQRVSVPLPRGLAGQSLPPGNGARVL